MQLQELYIGGYSSATFNIVALDASQLVLRISNTSVYRLIALRTYFREF